MLISPLLPKHNKSKGPHPAWAVLAGAILSMILLLVDWFIR